MNIFKSRFSPSLSLQLSLVFGILFFITSWSHSQNLDVPYVPTPKAVVERMLDLAHVQPSDYVIDLGAGDGRIVIAAAKRGASAHGIDLDPQRIKEARQNASDAGVNNKVIFKQENIFDTDFSRASVITMYLLPTVNKKLRTKLLNKLEPGTRIVSHSFDMGEWKADKEVTVSDGNRTHEIYYWVIPAKVTGSWHWSADGKKFNMDIKQNYQEISVNMSEENGTAYDIEETILQGKRIMVRAVNGTHTYILNGKVEGNKIKGIIQNHNNTENSFTLWEASL